MRGFILGFLITSTLLATNFQGDKEVFIGEATAEQRALVQKVVAEYNTIARKSDALTITDEPGFFKIHIDFVKCEDTIEVKYFNSRCPYGVAWNPFNQIYITKAREDVIRHEIAHLTVIGLHLPIHNCNLSSYDWDFKRSKKFCDEEKFLIRLRHKIATYQNRLVETLRNV